MPENAPETGKANVTELRVPQRIQRRRTKGWRMPPNTVYVGRPSKWGNDLRVGQVLNEFAELVVVTPQMAVDYFKADIEERIEIGRANVRELHGKDLACWCPLVDKDGNRAPCHADVLLELANPR